MKQLAVAIGSQILTGAMMWLSSRYHLNQEQLTLVSTDVIALGSAIAGGIATWGAYKTIPPGAGK